MRNFQRLQANLSPRPIGLKDIPPELRRKFTSERGRFLLHIQPAVDIWDREGAVRFVTELRSVDPEVTGTPIITFEAIRYMEGAYRQGTLYAFLLVGLLSAAVVRRTPGGSVARVWTRCVTQAFQYEAGRFSTVSR